MDVVLYNLSAGEPAVRAIAEGVSEHTTSNLSAGVTEDGIVHLLAAAVFGRDNQSRVYHLRFDPGKSEWLESEVLFERSDFTGSITPCLVAEGRTVDAFWLRESGRDTLASNGLYAYRIGESAAWRLTNATGDYTVLPNADGHGALLVGVAINPHEDGRILWFIRRGDVWKTAGEIDLGVKLYTLCTSGNEPFALWRDPSGTIHAALLAEGGLHLIDLKLPE